jgi:hypothetical protein
VKKGSHTARQTSAPLVLAERVERCPECGHAWDDVGPVHFADCRFFWVEEDRDDDAIVLTDAWSRISHEAA